MSRYRPLLLVLALLVLPFAAMIWWLIEKPAMNLKDRIPWASDAAVRPKAAAPGRSSARG